MKLEIAPRAVGDEYRGYAGGGTRTTLRRDGGAAKRHAPSDCRCDYLLAGLPLVS